MALVSLFFQTRAKLNQLDLDASVSETHEAGASLTQNEVEGGDNITDHVNLSPIKLTIEGVVSKTPLGKSALVGSAATAGAGLIGKSLGGPTSLLGQAATVGLGSVGGLVSNAVGIDSGVDKSDGSGKSRDPKDVYTYLLELRDRRVPFEVITALRSYEKMILTSLSIPRNVANRNVLRFTATLEQVRIVSAQEVNVVASAALAGKADPATKLGKQGTTAVGAKAGESPSLFYQGLQYGGIIK